MACDYSHAAGVLVLAATNRPEAIDPALLRPGRFDVSIKVCLPDADGRLAILKIHCRDFSLAPDVNLQVSAQGSKLRPSRNEMVCKQHLILTLASTVTLCLSLS